MRDVVRVVLMVGVRSSLMSIGCVGCDLSRGGGGERRPLAYDLWVQFSMVIITPTRSRHLIVSCFYDIDIYNI